MEHRLWVQLRSYNSSDKAAFKALDKAWEAAVANLNGVGIRTKEEVHDDAVEWAFLWAERITDGIDGLTDTEAAVLGYVVSETERRGMMQVTCPSRAGEGAISADEVVQASFDQNFAEITRKTDPEKGALLVWILCGVDVGFRTVMSLLRRDGGQVSVPSKVALSNGSWIISLLNKKE